MHVVVDDEQVEQVRTSWQQWQHQLAAEEETHLLIIESPYRSLLRPILAYIKAVHQRHTEDILTVIVLEFVVAHRWEYVLHNRMALHLKAALLFRPGVAVLNLPQHLRGRMTQRRPPPCGKPWQQGKSDMRLSISLERLLAAYRCTTIGVVSFPASTPL